MGDGTGTSLPNSVAEGRLLSMSWTSMDVMTVLYIVVAVMLIIILYHVLFIVVDIRKSMRRVDRISESIEGLMMKPLNVADEAMQWAVEFIAEQKHKHQKHAKHTIHDVHAHHEKKEHAHHDKHEKKA